MNPSMERQFKEYFADKKLEMIKMLREFVNVDSHTYNKTGVDRLGDTITNKMTELGFSLKTIQQKEFGNQITAKNSSRGKNHVLILVHLDTVLPYKRGDYSFRIKNRKIALGPGVADMKASLVQIYYVLKAFQDLKIGERGPLTIFFNTDEEAGSPVSRKWIENEARRSDFCLVLEPARPNGALVVERKGTGIFEMEMKGKPAHCGIEPEKGASAIEELAKKITLLHGLTDYRKGITVNVGIVKGGVARNMIAESAYAKIDVRMKSPKQIDWVIQRIKEIGRKKLTRGTRTKLSGGLNRPPMTPTQATHRFIYIIREEAHKIGLEVSFVATGGASDGNFVSALGIPTIDGMGPIGGKLCTPDEYLLLDSLPERSALLALVILRLWSQALREAGSSHLS